MSNTVTQGPWETFTDEPDKEAQDHAGAALYAMQGAQKHAQEAAKHADTAAQHADRMAKIEEMLERAEQVAGPMESVAHAIAVLIEQMHAQHQESMKAHLDAHKEAMGKLSTALSKPRKLVRDKDGRASGVEVG